jgi:molybdopterin molybdotransferase
MMLKPVSPPLLSIDEARALVTAAAGRLPVEALEVGSALDRVLAADVVADHDVPSFAASAMDGFALRSGPAERSLRLVGESRAGTPWTGTVGDGEAVRISTGAVVPAGADAVLQLELVTDDGGQVVIHDAVTPGRNIRGAGEDLRAGAIVLTAGTRLGPAELGVAVHAGAAELRCSRRPRVAVLATGDELVAPGTPLGPGQIHDSNRVTLAALAGREGADVILAERVPDDPQATREAIARALEQADLLLLSGGVSVGPHDHVKPALAALGVDERFWRVALRPGKPTWFGVRDDRLVLGLPGNPVSAMVTFLLFARPALAAMQGAVDDPSRRVAPLGEAVARHAARDECLRVRLIDGRVHATGPQGSHVLSSMAQADALAIIPRGEGELPAGTDVELLSL